jgi:hypothetical protein
MELPLLSLEEGAKKKCKIPYVYELKSKDRALLVLGASHTNNPKDKQFSIFRAKFFDFKPEIVFVEGGFDRGTWKSEAQAISIGENAFLSHLAKSSNITVESWEPWSEDSMQSLLKEYSKEDIFAHHLLQVIPQFIRLNKPEGYMEKHIISFKKTTNWKGFDYSMYHLQKLHNKLYKKDIDFNNSNKYTFTPFSSESIMNKISAYEMRMRDAHAVKVITSAFVKHKRVLALMGSSHAVIQEPAFREFFSRK